MTVSSKRIEILSSGFQDSELLLRGNHTTIARWRGGPQPAFTVTGGERFDILTIGSSRLQLRDARGKQIAEFNMGKALTFAGEDYEFTPHPVIPGRYVLGRKGTRVAEIDKNHVELLQADLPPALVMFAVLALRRSQARLSETSWLEG